MKVNYDSLATMGRCKEKKCLTTPKDTDCPRTGVEDGHQKRWIALSVLVCFVAIFFSFSKHSSKQTDLAKLDENGRRLMLKYDYNKDQMLSVSEVRDLLQEVIGGTRDDEGMVENLESAVLHGDEFLNISATFEGMHLDSMSQKKIEEGFGTPEFEHKPCFHGLVNWTKPHTPEKEFLAKYFCDFALPEKGSQIGDVYWIIPAPQSTDKLSNLRYRPPSSKNQKENFLSSLLGMFHPNIFPIMRFAPQGTAGVVRAQSQHYLEVHVRIHAEFQLNESPQPHFWFTPGRFEGQVILSRDPTQCHVRDFYLELPTESSLNVDMEWVNEQTAPEDGSDNLEVDIGFISVMSLQSTTPSSPVVLHDDDGTLIDRRDLWNKGEDLHFEFDPIVWDEEIETDEAKSLLEEAFFPFTKVKYLPFAEAFTEAKLKHKPVHQIVLWGALNDQSC